MEYNQFSEEKIKKLIAIGQKAAQEGQTEEGLYMNNDYSLHESEFITIGFQNPDFKVGEVKEFYRIGEPIMDEMAGCYRNSYNFAEQRPEDGVSVVTTAWLQSFKSIFFGTSDDKIRKKGIYKIKGLVIPSTGGDDEILICPVDFAQKTKIRTRNGLEKAVAKLEARNIKY